MHCVFEHYCRSQTKKEKPQRNAYTPAGSMCRGMTNSYQTYYKKKIVEQMPPYRQHIGMTRVHMTYTIAPRILEQNQQRNNKAMHRAYNCAGNS
jgi:hypothetical protein